MTSAQKYRGIITDRLCSMDTLYTGWYKVYGDAHLAAEKLCKKTMRERGNISVEEK